MATFKIGDEVVVRRDGRFLEAVIDSRVDSRGNEWRVLMLGAIYRAHADCIMPTALHDASIPPKPRDLAAEDRARRAADPIRQRIEAGLRAVFGRVEKPKPIVETHVFRWVGTDGDVEIDGLTLCEGGQLPDHMCGAKSAELWRQFDKWRTDNPPPTPPDPLADIRSRFPVGARVRCGVLGEFRVTGHQFLDAVRQARVIGLDEAGCEYSTTGDGLTVIG